MTARDPVIELLRQHAEKGNETGDVILGVDGILITGRIVGLVQFLRAMRSHSRTPNRDDEPKLDELFGSPVADLLSGEESAPDTHIHLTDVQMLHGGGTTLAASAVIRVPVDRISLFAFGSLRPQRQ